MMWRLFRGASVTLVTATALAWGVWRLFCWRIDYVDKCATRRAKGTA